MAIRAYHRGNWKKTTSFLKQMEEFDIMNTLNKYGQLGVELLSANTPKDSGTTSSSWSYKINKTDYGMKIDWTNSNVNQGLPIAILIQYGHGTGTGGYVPPTDYINGPTKEVLEQIVAAIDRELKNG